MYILMILEFLINNSSRDNRVSVSDISEYLKSRGVESQKKTIRANLSRLMEFFKDNKYLTFAEEEGPGGRKMYRVEQRIISVEDAANVVSCLCADDSFDIKYKQELTEKICHIAGEASRYEFLRLIEDGNFKIKHFEHIDSVSVTLSEAVGAGRKVRFKYRRNTAAPELNITASPYKIIQKNCLLYLLADCDKYDISVFRLDKITEPEITDEAADKPPADACSSSIYEGKEMEIIMLAHSSIMDCIYNRYGYDVNRCREIDGRIRIIAKDKNSADLMGWLFMLGNKIEILHPEALKTEYKSRLKSSLKNMV